MNILLLMPDFFDYPKIIIEELQSRNHNVDFVCNETDEYFRYLFRKRNIIYRILRFLCPFLRKYDLKQAEKFGDSLYSSELARLKRNSYDVVLCIKGDFFPETQYAFLHNRYSTAKFVIYQWDDLSLLRKTKHLKWFDEKFSYSIFDCKRNGFHYLPMFSKVGESVESSAKKYDIAVIGTIDHGHEKRLRLVEKIYNKYSKKFLFFLYLYRVDEIQTDLPSFKEKLPYDDYISALRLSKCVLDVSLVKQEGPTTRFNDAVGTMTKVITTNKNIKNYPIYSDNILIIDEKEPNIDEQFVATPYVNNGLDFMSVEKWCNIILE